MGGEAGGGVEKKGKKPTNNAPVSKASINANHG